MPNRARGFTLLELIVVMALIVMVAGFGLIISMESYRGYSFRSERDMVVVLLQKARSQAVSNICIGACTAGKPHGVHFATGQYVIYQGESYATRDVYADETIEMRYKAVSFASPSFTDITFSRLAATTTPNPLGVSTLSLVDSAGKDSSVITVNTEGQITWTN